MARRRPKGWVPMAQDERWLEFAARYSGDLERFSREVSRLDPSDQQIELFTEVNAPRSRVSVASGHGCFGIGTMIRMSDGRGAAVETLQAGDCVMGQDGTAKRILSLIRGRQAMYRFEYVQGGAHVFNESHNLWVIEPDRVARTVTVARWLRWSPGRKLACRMVRKTDAGDLIPLEVLSCAPLGEGDYYGFELEGSNGLFLADDGTVLSNTGKTTSIATIILWHLLCFPASVTLVTANDMDQLKATLWKEVGAAIERIRTGPHGWLHPHIDLMADGSCRIVGYEETWFIESKTANEKSANKMAGRHAKWLLIVGDEASTLADTVCSTLQGALTEEYNRFLLTSQPTRNAGFFYDTFHRLSIANGGEWVNLVLDSFDSPFVSDEALKGLWDAYDDDERRVRLLGLFPQDSSKHMMPRRVAEAMYKRGRIIKDHEPYGWLVLGDIASGEGLRDKAAVVIAKVIGWGDRGEMPRRVEVHTIPIFTNKIRANVLANHMREHGSELPGVTYVPDSGGLGITVCQDLEDGGAIVKRVTWGNPCFQSANKSRYINLRAQAMHQAARAAKEGRLSILTNDYQRAMLDQSSRIPKSFSDKGLIKVPPKGATEWDGLGSPDLWDAVCFAFMEGVEYIPVGGAGGNERREQLATETAVSEAQDAFADVD